MSSMHLLMRRMVLSMRDLVQLITGPSGNPSLPSHGTALSFPRPPVSETDKRRFGVRALV